MGVRSKIDLNDVTLDVLLEDVDVVVGVVVVVVVVVGVVDPPDPMFTMFSPLFWLPSVVVPSNVTVR